MDASQPEVAMGRKQKKYSPQRHRGHGERQRKKNKVSATIKGDYEHGSAKNEVFLSLILAPVGKYMNCKVSLTALDLWLSLSKPLSRPL